MNTSKVLMFATLVIAVSYSAVAETGSSNSVAPVGKRPLLESVRKFMVDPQATPETVALFFNLKKIAKRGQTLIGQQDPEQSVSEKGG